MKFSILIMSASVALTFTSQSFADTTTAKKKPAIKVIHTTSLRTALKPGTAPGRTPVPTSNGDFYSGSQMSVKMKSKTAAKHLPAKTPSRNVAAMGRPTGVIEPVSNYIRAIRVGYNGPVPQLAMGQALAVADSYIVTSADFVTDAWTNSGDIKFFVSDSSQPLALVAFDLGSNLAIFSTGIGSHMEHTLPITRLRFEAAQPGEDFTSLGMTGLIGGARRFHPVQDLTFVRDRFELPASVAMTGGTPGTQFLFDKTGRWTGTVSLLDQRDGRRFDVTSSNQAFEMIRALEQHAPVPLTAAVLLQQAQSWQERWTNTFFDSAKKGLALRTLDCEADALHVDDQKIASAITRTRLVHCANSMPVSLTRDFSMGVELVTGDVSFSDEVRSFLAQDVSPATVFAPARSGRSPASINVMTGPECEKSDVANSHGHHVQVRFCTSALKNVSGLNDTTISVVSSDTGQKSTVHSMRLRGFDPKNAKRFMEWMIDTETLQ